MIYFLIYYTPASLVHYKVYDSPRKAMVALCEEEFETLELHKDLTDKGCKYIIEEGYSAEYHSDYMGLANLSVQVISSEYVLNKELWGDGDLYNDISHMIISEKRNSKLDTILD